MYNIDDIFVKCEKCGKAILESEAIGMWHYDDYDDDGVPQNVKQICPACFHKNQEAWGHADTAP